MCTPISRLDGIHEVMVCVEHNSVGGLTRWHIIWREGIEEEDGYKANFWTDTLLVRLCGEVTTHIQYRGLDF